MRAIAIPKTIRKKGDPVFGWGRGEGVLCRSFRESEGFQVSPEGKEQISTSLRPRMPLPRLPYSLKDLSGLCQALSDCQVLFFPKRAFIQLMRENPQLSINMIVTLSQYLKRFAILIEELS